MSFEGEVILITGASSGIGAACAHFFANKGALLALVGRNAEKFKAVVGKIRENGVEVEPLVIVADVSTDAERIMSETIGKYGKLDILINNAGFAINGSLEQLKMADYDAMMATNTRAVVELSQRAIYPYLIKSKGNIVNVSSAVSLMSVKGSIGYCMTKAALDQFTKCCAMEVAEQGVRVNSINPAVVATNFFDAWAGVSPGTEKYRNLMDQFKGIHPLQRHGTTEDVVNAIAFLADDNARFITGIILPLDGGLTKKSGF